MECVFLEMATITVSEEITNLSTNTNVNKIYRFVLWYIKSTIKLLDIIHRLVFYLNSTQFYRFVPTSQEIYYASTTSPTD
jgi:hypothetical protein